MDASQRTMKNGPRHRGDDHLGAYRVAEDIQDVRPVVHAHAGEFQWTSGIEAVQP